MHKCYTFLIFMVLLLPSLGLSRWVSEEGVGAGVGDGKKRSSQGPQVWGASSELLDGTLSPLVFWLLQPLTPPSPLFSSPAWTSSSAGSLTRNSWLRQLSGLSE